MVKMVVLAPIASASERMATALNPGFLKSARNAYVKSWRMMMLPGRSLVNSRSLARVTSTEDDADGLAVGRARRARLP